MIFENINISYGDKKIFENYNFRLKNEKITVVIGQSGIGKTTLLNYISKELSNINKKHSYVFQENNLIPWMTVEENLKIILDEYCIMTIDQVLNIVQLKESKNKYPYQLSGGMLQRVNLARAIMRPGYIIILDEAFKSIDNKTKYTIIEEMKKIIDNNKLTVLIVTHDLEETKMFNREKIELVNIENVTK